MCVSDLTETDNVTASIIAEKDLKSNILREKVNLVNKLRILISTYQLYRLGTQCLLLGSIKLVGGRNGNFRLPGPKIRTQFYPIF